MVKWKGKYCASSGFLDLADNCRNPDGCVCAYMQTAYTRAEAAERELAERDADLARVREALTKMADVTEHYSGLGLLHYRPRMKADDMQSLAFRTLAALAGSGDGWRATLTREEAEKLCARLEFDASWDKAGHGYYSLKRQLAASPSTAGER